MAPIEFVGPTCWDDSINQPATLHKEMLSAHWSHLRISSVGVTRTLLSGYADDLFNTWFRLEAGRMKELGYERARQEDKLLEVLIFGPASGARPWASLGAGADSFQAPG